MQLPEHERQAHRDAFRAMSIGQKIEYIFAYYKLPLVLIFVAAVALGSALHQRFTYKAPILYVGMANVSTSEDVELALTTDYVRSLGKSTRREEVYLYRDLYLVDPEESSDHQLSYASRLKVLATIDAEELDVVLMSKQAYDLLSHSGYLMDLSTISRLPDVLSLRIASNDVIIEDNELDLQLGEADTYEAVTETVPNAFDARELPLFQGLSDDVYLGIIGNTPRLDAVLAYLTYVCTY